jgi:hypothetical protein
LAVTTIPALTAQMKDAGRVMDESMVNSLNSMGDSMERVNQRLSVMGANITGKFVGGMVIAGKAVLGVSEAYYKAIFSMMQGKFSGVGTEFMATIERNMAEARDLVFGPGSNLRSQEDIDAETASRAAAMRDRDAFAASREAATPAATTDAPAEKMKLAAFRAERLSDLQQIGAGGVRGMEFGEQRKLDFLQMIARDTERTAMAAERTAADIPRVGRLG